MGLFEVAEDVFDQNSRKGFVHLVDGFLNCGKVDTLGLEILFISFSVTLSLTTHPITSLVDSTFVGHLGSVELATIGVSFLVLNLVSKLFNIFFLTLPPLLLMRNKH